MSGGGSPRAPRAKPLSPPAETPDSVRRRRLLEHLASKRAELLRAEAAFESALLLAHGDGASYGELGEACGISRQATFKIVQRLQRPRAGA